MPLARPCMAVRTVDNPDSMPASPSPPASNSVSPAPPAQSVAAPGAAHATDQAPGGAIRFFSRVSVALIGACMLGSLAVSLPLFYRIAGDEISPESFRAPESLEAFIPDFVPSARYEAIMEICQTRPPGSVGMAAETYARLPPHERRSGNFLAYLAFEKIVEQTGQPIRFRGPVPPGIKYVIAFVPAEDAQAESVEPLLRFEDMALYGFESTK